MRRLLLAFVFVAALLPGAARSAACSPLNCAPSQLSVAGGSLLAVRGAVDKPVRVIDLATGQARWTLPAGLAAGDVLVHQGGNGLTWYDMARGTAVRHVSSTGTGAAFYLAGLSQSGATAVLQRTHGRQTSFALVSRQGTRTITLAGKQWSFDALRGDKLYLIKTLSYGYQVRLYDLAAGKLRAAALKDPHESSTIWGIPFSRVASADGKLLYTLYIGQDGGSMVHILDLAHATARCVDLPGDGDFSAAATYALALSKDGTKLWAVSPGYGRAVTIDVHARRVVGAFRFDAWSWTGGGAGLATLAPDGEHIAVTEAAHVWLVDPAARTVTRPVSTAVWGLAFSPDGRHLWAVGARRATELALT